MLAMFWACLVWLTPPLKLHRLEHLFSLCQPEALMQIAFWLGLGLPEHFPFSGVLRPHLAWSCLWMSYVCAWQHSLCEFTCTSDLLCLEGTVSLKPSIASGSCNLPAPSFTKSLNLERGALIKTPHLELSATKFLTLCVIVPFFISKGSFLNGMEWIYQLCISMGDIRTMQGEKT